MKSCLLSLTISMCLFAPAAHAAGEEPAAPHFFNQKERLPLPSLQGLNRLRFITTVDFPPFNRRNERGQLSGYNIDLAKALCQQLKIEDICQIEAVPWAELEERVLDGQADAIIAGWDPTDRNREKFTFTRSYMRLPARFATSNAKSFTEPAAKATQDKPVGVIAGTAHEALLKNYFPQAKPVPYPNRDAMLTALKDGKIDTVFDDGMSSRPGSTAQKAAPVVLSRTGPIWRLNIWVPASASLLPGKIPPWQAPSTMPCKPCNKKVS